MQNNTDPIDFLLVGQNQCNENVLKMSRKLDNKIETINIENYVYAKINTYLYEI